MALAVLVALVGIVTGYLTASTSGPQPLPVDDTVVSGPLSSEGGPYLTDSHGRVVFLRGVNAVYKRAPYEPVSYTHLDVYKRQPSSPSSTTPWPASPSPSTR